MVGGGGLGCWEVISSRVTMKIRLFTAHISEQHFRPYESNKKPTMTNLRDTESDTARSISRMASFQAMRN